jgi:hypothetical protein
MIPNYLVSLCTLSFNLSTQGFYTCEPPDAVYTERELSPSYKRLTKLNHAWNIREQVTLLLTPNPVGGISLS